MTRERTLADEVLRTGSIPAAAHLVLVVLVGLLVWGTVPTSMVVPWLGAVILIVGARSVLWPVVNRPTVPTRTAIWVARATMAALGLAWGVGTAIAGRALPATTFAFLLVGLAGLVAGGIATLVADRWIFPSM